MPELYCDIFFIAGVVQALEGADHVARRADLPYFCVDRRAFCRWQTEDSQ